MTSASPSEDRTLAELPEMNPGPVLRLTRGGSIKLANRAAHRLFGGDLVGRSWSEICKSMPGEVWDRALQGREGVIYESEINGRCYSFALAHRPGTEAVFLYGSDITPLKEAQRTIVDMARFPEMNPGIVCKLDRNGIVVLANGAARRSFGDQELVGRCWLDICPGVDQKVWAMLLDASETVTLEATILDRAILFTYPGADGAGERRTVFAYGSDITALKTAERSLAELAQFPEMNPGPVCRLTPDGTVLLANRAARKLFQDEDLVGRSWVSLCPGMTEERWQRFQSSPDVSAHEARVGTRDMVFSHTPGAGGQVFVYGTDITEQKAAQRALQQTEKLATLGTLAAGVAHELNNPAAAAQRAAEHLRLQLAELHKAQLRLSGANLSEERVKLLLEEEGRLRARVQCACDLDPLAKSDRETELAEWLEDRGLEDAWELAPACVDMGYDLEKLASLADSFGEDATPAVVAWLARSFPVYVLLEEIHQGSGRITEIVGALKAYSYVGQAPLGSVDINAGIRNTLIILRNKLKGGVRVVQELAADLPSVLGYGGELNQVWTNLIDNAADAMNEKGQLVLRTKREGTSVVVEVQDDGPGIPPEVQERIYDAFFTTKPLGKGTGLGLNTTYNVVVKKHEGKIELESRPGLTRFSVSLPIRPPGSAESPAPPPASQDAEGPR